MKPERAIALWFAGAITALPGFAPAQTGVSVKTVSEEAVAGRLENFSFQKGLFLQGREQIVADEVVAVHTAAGLKQPPSNAFQFDLAGGDRLFGWIVSGDKEVVTLETPSLGELRVGLAQMRAIITPAARGSEAAATAARLTQAPPSDDDIVLLGNGDRLAGLIADVDAKRIRMERGDQTIQVAINRVLAVRLARSDAGARSGLRARLFLDDQSVTTVDDLQWTGSRIQARYAAGGLSCEPEHLLRMEIIGGRWVWLADMQPVRFQHTPSFSLSWPWQRDRNVVGGMIRIAGQAFDHGIGVHAESVLVYDLGGAYERFVARVGIDDDAGPLADVDVEIRLDGETRFRAASLRSGQKPVRLDLPLNNAGRMELLVRARRNADIQDRVDWADAALIKKAETGR